MNINNIGSKKGWVTVMAECNRVDDSLDSDTELPQGGYYDVDFIDPPPDSLQCPVCLSALKQPHILSCCSSHICEVRLIQSTCINRSYYYIRTVLYIDICSYYILHYIELYWTY